MINLLDNNHINIVIDRALGATPVFEGLPGAQSLNDLKRLLAPLIFDTTLRWNKVESPIEKKDLNIYTLYWFGFINNSIISSQKESLFRQYKASYLWLI